MQERTLASILWVWGKGWASFCELKWILVGGISVCCAAKGRSRWLRCRSKKETSINRSPTRTKWKNHRRLEGGRDMDGDAGDRTPCLSHAKRALYHLSYIPCCDLSLREQIYLNNIHILLHGLLLLFTRNNHLFKKLQIPILRRGFLIYEFPYLF